jgi:molybdopterin synthase catalytic subunit
MPFLTAEPINILELLESVATPDCGGVATFLGTVRNRHAGREVVGLEYSAYEEMAEGECARLVAETEARWPVSVRLKHRLGRLELGEVAVAIVVAGGHRDEAFAGCRHLIEEIKSRVPIWKREFYADGSVAWVDPTAGGRAPSFDHA